MQEPETTNTKVNIHCLTFHENARLVPGKWWEEKDSGNAYVGTVEKVFMQAWQLSNICFCLSDISPQKYQMMSSKMYDKDVLFQIWSNKYCI